MLTGVRLSDEAYRSQHGALRIILWLRSSSCSPPCCVNLSPRQLEPESLVADVLAILRDAGYRPADLVLEVTESALVNTDSAIPQLTALHDQGIRIALDDFGTGYSSLRYLTRLPVDVLKIDRCFVAELNGNPQGSAVAEAVIRLGNVRHLDIVAEGVAAGIEKQTQAAELSLLGCRTGQGYHYARPLAPEAVQALIEGLAAGVPHGTAAAAPIG